MSAPAKTKGGRRRIRGMPKYDETWIVPAGGFKVNTPSRQWRKVHHGCTAPNTIFHRLTKLGVLEKVDGPVRHDPKADRRLFGRIPGIVFEPKVALPPRRNQPRPKRCP
jgi:hypothetical protein